MVNPGSFRRTRRKFLEDQAELYATAVRENHVADTIADIQRRYFKHYPISLSHTEEPSQEFLDSMDDDAPDPELTAPKRDGLDEEEYGRARRVYEFQVLELKMRKAQIKRRLQYEYSKSSSNKVSFEVGLNDPMSILMAQLTGHTTRKPRQKTPYNLWGPKNRFFVNPIFNKRVAEGNIPAKKHAALRSSIYKELFDELPDDEKAEWAELAEQQHQEAIKNIEASLKTGPNMSLEDRQRVIQGLPAFVEPILDLICQFTGWKATLLVGGPEPADNGRLNMISIHSGVTQGTTKMNFGRSEHKAYKDYIIPTFRRFLGKCYSVKDCRDAALPKTSDLASVLNENPDLDGHSFGDKEPSEREHYVKIAGPQGGISGAAKQSKSPTVNQTISSAGASKAPLKAVAPPLGIKIGPPKGSKKTSTSSTTTAQHADPKLSTSPDDGACHANGGRHESRERTPAIPSRAPTPFMSRPPTPIPHAVSTDQLSATTNAGDTPVLSSTISASEDRATAAAPGDAGKVAPTTMDTSADSAQLSPALSADSAALVNIPDSSCEPAASTTTTTPMSPLCGSTVNTAKAVPATISEPNSTPAVAPLSSEPNSPPTVAPPSSEVASPSAATHEPNSTPVPADQLVAPQHQVVQSQGAPAAEKQNRAEHPGSIAVPDLDALTKAESGKRTRKRRGTDSVANGSTSKKARASTTKAKSPNENIPPSQKRITTSADASERPAWYEKSLEMFDLASLGPEWRLLVTTWMKFEAQSHYESPTNLGTQNRPRIIKDWIQRARKPTFRPDIGSLDKFKTSFTSWWQSLQPEWRLGEGTATLQRGDKQQWGAIQRAGPNGLVSAVAALFFWGMNVVTNTTEQAEWLAAVDDATYVLSHLI